ncbi:putative surface protein with fasciclin (FAS1) repeats [Nocardia transvalensis]|uniref:Putative surface protein with fasciclin (FAS1) repeats n=1 Tax=Nocardia transvalensis TaxID=37333 RepID=A0A7W9PMF6_9NOCA|nr:fasciclin domain-containing protein [Nocardia transvalensis]MBB5918298.1 putative surface protein with fasciclin (FAS1) repeats [Nocardia transvalensis]
MKLIQRSAVLAIAVAAAALGVAGCSDDNSDSGSATTTSTAATSAAPVADPAADLVGPGCKDYAAQVPTGAGSVSGMAQDPVTVAASHNPLLTTLTAAVSGKLNPQVNLVDTLNGGQFTVFAPVDSAFAKVPPATLDSLKTDSATLTKILTYHVVPGQIAPDKIAGAHKTVEGDQVTVTRDGSALEVGDAAVVCGGVKTANATVYLIDSVLMPPN